MPYHKATVKQIAFLSKANSFPPSCCWLFAFVIGLGIYKLYMLTFVGYDSIIFMWKILQFLLFGRKVMNKKILSLILALVFVFAVFSLTSCRLRNDKDDDSAIKDVYATYVTYAKEKGEAVLSYEEWLKEIKGEQGEPGADGANGLNGKDGITPKFKLEESVLFVSYDNGTSWNELGNVKGESGTNGANGQDGITPEFKLEGTKLLVSYDKGASWSELGNVKGESGTNGTSGVGIADIKSELVEKDGKTYIVFTYYMTDGTAKTSEVCLGNISDTPDTPTEPDVPCKYGHTWIEYISNGDATCTSDGTKSSKCENCDEIRTVVDAGSKLDHNYIDGKCVACGAKDPDAPAEPDDEYEYSDFTEEEKAIFEQYVGIVIPFAKTNEYHIEGYFGGDDYSDGINYYTLGNTQADFDAYRALFASYSFDGTDVDEYGDTWYLYSKDGVLVDMVFYQVEDAYYIDVYIYLDTESEPDYPTPDVPTGDIEAGKGYIISADNANGTLYFSGTVTGGRFDGSYSKADAVEVYIENAVGGFYMYFTKGGVKNYIVMNDSSTGAKLVTNAASATVFEWNSEKNTAVVADDANNRAFGVQRSSTYETFSSYDVKNDYNFGQFTLADGSSDTPVGDGSTGDKELITNAGAGLPNDTDGVFDVNFTDADNVKDVTDQGYYIDGCPTVGSPAVLVIPVEFSDITAASRGYSTSVLKEAFLEGGDTDYFSVYDYYFISSYGQLTLDITVLDSWFMPKYASTYYKNKTVEGEFMGDQMILDEALDYLADSMDLSEFDSDGNGIIDAVVLINTLEIDSDYDITWAYRYWNYYVDDYGYYYEYDGVSANDYLWASYQFLYENDGEFDDRTAVNTYTYIHEFAHVLGVDDYYDTEGINSPLGDYDVMDSMPGDHNAFTKINLGWITNSRLVVADSSLTLSLQDFSKSGDTIIIANNWDEKLGAYQEYYLIMYYTNGELNSGIGGYFDKDGILVYHINASLFKEVYEDEVYYDIYNTNTHESGEYGTKDNLIELVKAVDGSYLFTVGDTLPALKDDTGKALVYGFTVNTLTSLEATLTFTKG